MNTEQAIWTALVVYGTIIGCFFFALGVNYGLRMVVCK